MSYRPGGVTELAVIFILLAALGIGVTVFIEEVLVAGQVQKAFLGGIFSVMTGLSLGLPLGDTLLLATFSTASYQSAVGFYHIAAVIAIMYAAICLLTAIGLFGMKIWGYYLAFIIGIFDITVGVIGLFLIVGIIPLVFGIVVLVYLSRDIKDKFK
ncbi:MAG: hypothetical protein WED07_16115 [Candidatus Freyarchaeum deiterrae]